MNNDIENQLGWRGGEFCSETRKTLTLGLLGVAYVGTVTLWAMTIFELRGDDAAQVNRDLALSAFVICYASICAGIITSVTEVWNRTFD
jgi:hypothetical protein